STSRRVVQLTANRPRASASNPLPFSLVLTQAPSVETARPIRITREANRRGTPRRYHACLTMRASGHTLRLIAREAAHERATLRSAQGGPVGRRHARIANHCPSRSPDGRGSVGAPDHGLPRAPVG